jgi:hypothetical protein
MSIRSSGTTSSSCRGPPADYQWPSRNRRGNLLPLIAMSVKVGPADRRLTFGENTRNEHRPA